VARAGRDAVPDGLAAWQSVASVAPHPTTPPADVALAWLLAHAHAQAGRSWLQGCREPPLRVAESGTEWARLAWTTLATRHVYRVQAHVACVLARWQRGEVELRLTTAIPTPDDLLRGQAHGWRWLSLLPAGADCSHEATPFAFALHDLCHAAHYFDPAHHLAQCGFFASVWQATRTPGFQSWMAQWDDVGRTQFHKVCADMNGSVVFLWSALRKKIVHCAERAGRCPRVATSELAQWLCMPEPVCAAALRFSMHRDADPTLAVQDATVLEEWWRQAAFRTEGGIVQMQESTD